MANESGFGTGLVLGGAIGLLAGLLLAPKAGEQTRAEVVERTAGLRQRAEDMTADFRERVRETVREVMDEGRVVANRIMPAKEQEGAAAAEPAADSREETPA
ncbi:MAG: YtxH domain-containing protein [Chloroflexota bacterium]|nr:YtxH domain-containing protein [Chloroflexota bacterium]MDE2942204.1 YtxH domain-containing protein [Chloroflexota bacterium]MDE3267672.1 YtxH domain-containing protein [Chloroflexota bacterium]